MNPFASDRVPLSDFVDTTFENVGDDSWGHFMTPPAKWANVKDCGSFPCTAPLNVLLMFKGTKYTGQRPSFTQPDFQLISNNEGVSPYIPGCEKRESNNLYVCQQSKLAELLFESEDDDKWDRGMHPVYVQLQGTEMNNKVNSFMDHVWDGFYSGQLRLSRFPALIYAEKGTEYNLTFTGSPAKKFRFELKAQDRYAGTTIRIPYPSAESRKIVKDGQVVQTNQWDENASPPGYGAVEQKYCGENRFIGVKNILEFYIVPGCVLHIAPRNAIQTMVRMEWTFDEFFAGGGTTTFMDRVAGSLGIHASTIKIVSVYEGSLVVNYAIENDDAAELAAIQQAQTQQFATGAMNLGAPILDVQATVTSDSGTDTASSGAPVSIVTNGVVTAPGFDPIVITSTGSASSGGGANGQKEVFIPTVDIVRQNQTTYRNVTVGAPKRLETNNTSIIVIAAAAGIILLVACAYAVRIFYQKMFHEKIQKAAIKEQQLKVTVGRIGRQKVDALDARIPDSNAKIFDIIPDHVAQGDHDKYDEQYNPHHDFAIFGQGDPRGGGLQTLQQKMNLADEVAEGANSSDSDEPAEDGDKAATKNADGNYEEVAMASMSMDASISTARMDSACVLVSSDSANALPEDREIVEEADEEEEE